MNSKILTMTSVGALVASMAMVGCSKQDQADAKTATNDATAQIDQKAREVGRDASKGMEQAKESSTAMARDAKDAAKNAGEKISDKVADAVITTTVKAELAKDTSLSALKINVDTDNGRVALRGTAPSTSAREHATVLARAVKGVVRVDNQLTVDAGKS